MHEIPIGCLVLPYCRISSLREERVFSWRTLLEKSTSYQTIRVLYFVLGRGLFGPCVSHPYYVSFCIDNQINDSAGNPSLFLRLQARELLYRPNKGTVTTVDVLAGKFLFKLDLFENLSSLLGMPPVFPHLLIRKRL